MSTDYRTGTCTSCKAQFKVPVSFPHTRAKCKECGGVVEIPGATAAAAPAAAKASPAPLAPRPVPLPPKLIPAPAVVRPVPAPPAAAPTAAKPEAKPSMKEQILARQAAERGAAQAPQAAAAQPASAEPGAATALPKQKPAASAAPAVQAPATAAAPANAAAPAKSSRGSASEQTAGPRREGRGTREPKKKKKSLLMPLLGLVGLVAAGGGAVWWIKRDVASKEHPSEVQAQVPAPAADADPDQGLEASGAAESSTPSEQQATASSDAGSQAGSAAGSAPAAGVAAPEATKKPELDRDPASVDLASIPDYAPFPGTTDDEWSAIQADVALRFDLYAGAQGNKAGVRLKANGRKAFPAILNAFKRLDFNTEDGQRNGNVAQRLLTDICSGNNFDWRESTERKDVYFNKRVVEKWCHSWDQAKTDSVDGNKAWKNLAKLKDQPGEAPKSELDDLEQ